MSDNNQQKENKIHDITADIKTVKANTEQEQAPAKQSPSDRNERIKKIRRRRKIILFSGIALVLVLLMVIIMALFVVRVKNFKLKFEDNKPYSSDTITATLSEFKGKGLLSVDSKEINAVLCQKLPYIKNATVRRMLPWTLEITIESEEEIYAVEVNAGIYAITGSDMKILRTSNTLPEKLILVQGRNCTKGYDAGQKISFVNESGDDHIQNALSEIAIASNQNKLEKIVMIDVSDRSAIYMIYDKRIVVRIGNTNDIASKISLAKKSIDEENKISPQGYGILNVTNSGKGVFAPKDYKQIPELIEYNKMIDILHGIIVEEEEPEEVENEENEENEEPETEENE